MTQSAEDPLRKPNCCQSNVSKKLHHRAGTSNSFADFGRHCMFGLMSFRVGFETWGILTDSHPSYIGRTTIHLRQRIKEHYSQSRTWGYSLPLPLPPPTPSQRAFVRLLLPPRSIALAHRSSCASPASRWIVRLHVGRGLPRLRVPVGVQWKASST